MKNTAKLVLVATFLVLSSCGGGVSKSPKKAVGGQGQPCNSDGSCAPMLVCTDDICQTPPDNNTNVLPNNTNVQPNNTNVQPNNVNVDPNNLNVMTGFCGDGLLDLNEDCDGNVNGQSCVSFGYDGGELFCSSMCFYDDSNCFTETGNVCGNFIVEPPEVCDSDDVRGQTCQSLGFAGGELRCGVDCLDYDVNGCFNAACGNGILEQGEFCDAGVLNGQTCLSIGYDGGELNCNSACADYDVTGCWRCGNGRIDPGEECDGANFGGATCQSLGLGSGQLSCTNTCSLNESGCVDTPLMCGLPGGCTLNDTVACLCVGCEDNGVCGGTDDCVCADCQSDTGTCPDSSCNNDGSCDPFTENCRCADCASHAQCAP